jgi:uncharacterized protein
MVGVMSFARVRRWAVVSAMLGCALLARGAELVWVELLTNGIPAEMAPFYERTLGWTSERAGNGARDGVVLSRNGRPVAAVTYRAGEKMERMRSRWVPFFAVEGVDAAGSAADRLGGRVVETEHRGHGPAGSAILLTDAEGAVFGVVRRGDGAEPALGFWQVVLAREPVRAARFYRELFGAEVRDDARTPMFPHDFLLRSAGRDLAGVQPVAIAGGAGWVVLIGVADIDAATRAARREGGRVLRAPTIDLIGGRVAVIADPVGGVFGLYESLPLRGPMRLGTKAGETFEVEAL